MAIPRQKHPIVKILSETEQTWSSIKKPASVGLVRWECWCNQQPSLPVVYHRFNKC